MMDFIAGAPPSDTAPPSSRLSPSPFPGREDCWSEGATITLIDAWGERYLDLNRGNLRRKHWQEIADAVNRRHHHRRTDVQCKNRIDTLKKKFKIEKAKVSDSDYGDGGYSGEWPFFYRLDFLIGDNFPAKRHSPPASDRRKAMPAAKSPAWALPPVGPRSGTKKRPSSISPAPLNSYFCRSLSAFAAAAAVAAAEEEEGDDLNWWNGSERRKSRRKSDDDGEWEFGYKEVAVAIERFGEIYERVEAQKQRQMVELEKQRMQFAKDLEYQRMELFVETQVQLHKINSSKHSSSVSEMCFMSPILPYES